MADWFSALNNASARCGGVPLPLEPAFRRCALDCVIKALKSSMGLACGTTISIGRPAVNATGRRAFCKLFGADLCVAAGPVVDHDVDLPALAQLLADLARHLVRQAARRKGHHV